MEDVCVRERSKCWTEGERIEKERIMLNCKERDNKRKMREKSALWRVGSAYMFRSLTPHVKWVGPALLFHGLEFAFLSAPQFPAEQSVFFHFALKDDSLGLLWFTLSRIRAGRLLIIFYSLSSGA